MPKTHWVAKLDNGKVVEEFKGDYKEIKDKPSPWQRLVKYCEKKDLSITALQIKYKDRSWTLPLGAKEYYYSRSISGDIGGTDLDRYIFIGAVFDGYEVQIWVDEKDPNIMFNKVVK